MTGIAESEQSLVEMQQPIDIPGDANPTDKAQLKVQKQQQTNRIAQVSDRLAALRAELGDIERQIALLTEKLDEIPPPGTPQETAIDGEITSIADDRVVISVGSDDGVHTGMRLHVYRENSFLGSIEVFATAADSSSAQILSEVAQTPIRPGDRATMLMNSSASSINKEDFGESIYNDQLNRFKFRLEKIVVTSAAEAGEEFWVRYRGRGNPQITGVWGDPRTNSLVVVGPPEADQAIRETIAEWEGSQIGIDMREDASLERQYRQLKNTRRTALEQVARRKLEIIEAQAREKPDTDQLKELNRKLETEMEELELVERKLQVISDSIERLQGNGIGYGNTRDGDPTAREVPGKTPLWNAFGVTPARVSSLTAKGLEWIGLHLSPIAKDRFRERNVLSQYTGGLDVTFVRSHGPAEKAGINEVDIVVKLQGRSVSSLDRLDAAMQFAVEQIQRGDADGLQFDVLRGGEILSVSVPFDIQRGTPRSNFHSIAPAQRTDSNQTELQNPGANGR